MTVKTKDPIKLDQILKLLFSTSERVLLDTLTSIFNIKLKGKDIKIVKSNNEFITADLENVHGDVFYEILESGEEKSIKFHIEFQTLNDSFMVVRMFEYGFQKAKEGIDKDIYGITIRFPKQKVIFIEENKNIQDTLEAKIILPDNNEIKYSVPVMKYWEYTDKMLIKNKMYPLLPLQLFLLRKRVVKLSKNNNDMDLKTISKEITNLAWELGRESQILLREKSIEYEDYEKFLIAIKSLLEYYNENYIKDELLNKEAEIMVKTLYDPEVERVAIEKGIQKGIEKGIQKGIQKGKQEDIIELLNDLGKVPTDIIESVEKIDDLVRLKQLLKIAARETSFDNFRRYLFREEITH